MCIQATEAIAALHNAPSPILHKDIKSSNFLVQNNSKLFLTEFGHSKYKIHEKPASFATGISRWSAPEILAIDPPLWTEKADIFSLGMVLYEIVAKVIPYREEPNINTILDHKKRGILPKFPSDSVKVIKTD